MSIFVDFGEKHICFDENGEEISIYSVSKVEYLENGDIGVECFTEGLKFEKGN